MLLGADLRKGMCQRRFVRMHANVALNLLAGSMVGAMHTLTSARVPRDFAEQTAAAVLRALGLPDDAAVALSTQALPAPVIETGTLLGQLLARRTG